MKKQILLVALFLVSLAGFAQKAEMKIAKKAIANGAYVEALSAIKQLETMTLDDKTKAKFLYFKVQALKGSGNLVKAASAIKALNTFESKIGKVKYGKLAKPMLNELIKSLSNKGIKEYKAKNYTLAKVTLAQVYSLSKKDTTFLEYAATAAYLDKDFDKSLSQFIALKDMGYTDKKTIYSAKTKDGELKTFQNEADMKKMVSLGALVSPKVEVTPSKLANIVKYIAYIYVEKGDDKKALSAIKDARASNPEDANLVITEGNIELSLGNKDRFKELMKEAIKLEPKNANLYYNIGVVSQQAGNFAEAIPMYEKAIELNPDNANAYANLGLAMLNPDKALVEELNNNLDNFDKYDQIKAKRKVLFKKVLPYFEKAYSLNKKDKGVIQTLINVNENLENFDKVKELKAILNGL